MNPIGDQMHEDPFAPNTISLVLSWALSIPTLIGFATQAIRLLTSSDGMPRALSTWIGLCVLLLSPLRYALFQIVLLESYAVQSVGALLSTLVLALYIPILIGLTHFACIGIPIVLTRLAVLRDGKTISLGRSIMAGVISPFACLLGSILFLQLLPGAHRVVGWLDADEVIRATNGPPSAAFSYIASPLLPMPELFFLTPQTSTDLLRCHVATIYLHDKELGQFIARQYPNLSKQTSNSAVP